VFALASCNRIVSPGYPAAHTDDGCQLLDALAVIGPFFVLRQRCKAEGSRAPYFDFGALQRLKNDSNKYLCLCKRAQSRTIFTDPRAPVDLASFARTPKSDNELAVAYKPAGECAHHESPLKIRT